MLLTFIFLFWHEAIVESRVSRREKKRNRKWLHLIIEQNVKGGLIILPWLVTKGQSMKSGFFPMERAYFLLICSPSHCSSSVAMLISKRLTLRLHHQKLWADDLLTDNNINKIQIYQVCSCWVLTICKGRFNNGSLCSCETYLCCCIKSPRESTFEVICNIT